MAQRDQNSRADYAFTQGPFTPPPPPFRGDYPDLKQLNLQGVSEKGKFGNVNKIFIALKQLWMSAKSFEIWSSQLPKMSSFIMTLLVLCPSMICTSPGSDPQLIKAGRTELIYVC